MKTINTRAINEKNTNEDYAKAQKCEYLLYDHYAGPALWHRCFCDFVPRQRNMPMPCELVWKGRCLKR